MKEYLCPDDALVEPGPTPQQEENRISDFSSHLNRLTRIQTVHEDELSEDGVKMLNNCITTRFKDLILSIPSPTPEQQIRTAKDYYYNLVYLTLRKAKHRDEIDEKGMDLINMGIRVRYKEMKAMGYRSEAREAVQNTIAQLGREK